MKRYAALVFLTVAVASNAGQTVFSSSTDDITTGKTWFTPSKKLASAVLDSTAPDQKELIREYLVANNIKGVRNLLAAVKVRLCGSCKDAYVFIRPASTRFSPWYGGHSFTYWLVSERGKVVHSAAVDSLDILDENTSALHPIQQSLCLTNQCFVTRLEFTGDSYSPVSCRTHDIANDKIVDGCKQP